MHVFTACYSHGNAIGKGWIATANSAFGEREIQLRDHGKELIAIWDKTVEARIVQAALAVEKEIQLLQTIVWQILLGVCVIIVSTLLLVVFFRDYKGG